MPASRSSPSRTCAPPRLRQRAFVRPRAGTRRPAGGRPTPRWKGHRAGPGPRTASGRPRWPTARPRPAAPSRRTGVRPAPRPSGVPRSRPGPPATRTTAGWSGPGLAGGRSGPGIPTPCTGSPAGHRRRRRPPRAPQKARREQAGLLARCRTAARGQSVRRAASHWRSLNYGPHRYHFPACRSPSSSRPNPSTRSRSAPTASPITFRCTRAVRVSCRPFSDVIVAPANTRGRPPLLSIGRTARVHHPLRVMIKVSAASTFRE